MSNMQRLIHRGLSATFASNVSILEATHAVDWVHASINLMTSREAPETSILNEAGGAGRVTKLGR
jgi:hypothetical protein